MNTEPEHLDVMMKSIAEGMVAEYDHGVDDGLKIALDGIKRSKDHPSLRSDALSGLNVAILVIELLQERLPQQRNLTTNTVSETNQGDTTNG